MTYIEKAFKEAIENGWTHPDWALSKNTVFRVHNGYFQTISVDDSDWKDLFSVSDAFIDPLFFQALGQAQGWKAPGSKDSEGNPNGEWVERWIHLVIHLAALKDAESYFKDIMI